MDKNKKNELVFDDQEIPIDTKEIDQEKSDIIYKIFANEDGEEFYTDCVPYIVNDKFIIKNYFQREVVRLQISGIDKEVGYRKDLTDLSITEKKEIDLKTGVIILKTTIHEISEWFSKSQVEARNELKDLELSEYRKIFPSLIQEINELKTHINSSNQNKKNNNSGLLDL